MKVMVIAFLLASAFVAHFDTALPAADLDVETIINNMKSAFEPEISSTRTLVFTIKDHGRVTNTMTAREGRKKLPDGKRTLLVMIEPAEVKGLSRLTWERHDGINWQWVYLPALKRTTRIVPINAYDSFQGTDFTYSDIGFIDVRGTHKLLGEEEHAGVAVYKIETIPNETWYYSRIITWVDKKNFLPLQRDLYDVSGTLWKTQLFEEGTVINNIPTPLQIRMLDVQAQTSTEYKVSEVCYGADIPDEVFKPTGLANALQYDFCPLPAARPQ